ncbi:hypothetical protein E2C01_020629 [Portunus trituberculatus]|uniref:Uncharacterized protein n=1 Tax=Portunus trituberculatus TaxID=210409 RepID=A0A5B7E230_PORTR|nr:hypothetical protein [Portunus trituberculatus]
MRLAQDCFKKPAELWRKETFNTARKSGGDGTISSLILFIASPARGHTHEAYSPRHAASSPMAPSHPRPPPAARRHLTLHPRPAQPRPTPPGPTPPRAAPAAQDPHRSDARTLAHTFPSFAAILGGGKDCEGEGVLQCVVAEGGAEWPASLSRQTCRQQLATAPREARPLPLLGSRDA